jgi:hypothetical protein
MPLAELNPEMSGIFNLQSLTACVEKGDAAPLRLPPTP